MYQGLPLVEARIDCQQGRHFEYQADLLAAFRDLTAFYIGKRNCCRLYNCLGRSIVIPSANVIVH